MQNGNPLTYNYAFSIGTLAADTWTKITKTIVGDSSLSFSNDNIAGLEISIVPFWGTNFTTSGSTTDAWYAWNGASRVPDMTSTWATTSGATFDVTGVQLEVGDTATEFEHRSYGEELTLCQRYYHKVTTVVEGGGLSLSLPALDSIVGIHQNFPVTMRAVPSLTLLGTAQRSGASSNAQRVSTNHFVWGRKRIAGGSDTAGAFATGGYIVDAEL
jgi:hypothetical protein